MEEKRQMRPHLTKENRLPRCFKEVEKVLRSVKSCQQNYKTILANSRLRGHIHKKVYSMTVNILKYYSYIQKIIDKVQLLEKEQYLRREIASVLIYELIFGNGFLPGESKIIKTIQLYENDIFHAHEVLQSKVESNLIIEISIPRYVRVHTLVTTVPYVIKDLNSYGYHQVIYDNELSEEKYLELVRSLNKGSFLIDFHFKDMLVFAQHENLVSLDLYKNGHIFLQDKSSYIPVHILNPQPGFAVLDACAAPGMKTVHIAAKMKNKGILIACERDKSRFEFLKEMLDCGSVKICKTLCKDFSLIDPSDQAYSTIEYILLDPSCSGSGMVNRMDEVTDTESSKNTDRLMKLAGFQIILLKHSLKFPAVKRVVYSTCSIHEEENEYVVHEALKAFSGTFKLMPAMSEWSQRGSEKFEFGKLCLRTDPKVHLTNGFFVAVFERINYDEYTDECQQDQEICSSSSFKKQKEKFSKQKVICETAGTEDYAEINIEDEYNISHSLDSCQKNNTEHNALLIKNKENSANYKPEQNLEFAQQINKKQKKKKRKNSNEYSYESNILNNEASMESVNYESEQNLEHTQQIKKKRKSSNECSYESNILNHETSKESVNYEAEPNLEYAQQVNKKKKKKRRKNSNECSYDANILNHEASQESVRYKAEQNLEYIQKINKKQKKKKRKSSNECSNDFYALNHETSNESAFNCSKLKEYSNVSFLENGDNASTLTRKEKLNDTDHHSKKNSPENIEIVEQFTNVTKLHKKKKEKRKEFLETEMLQSNELYREKQNTFYEQKCKVSKQDDSNLYTEIGSGSDVLFPSCTTSTHKKKKHLNIGCSQSYDMFKESNILDSCTMNDSNNRHQYVRNVFVGNEISQEFVDLTVLHKKKKKKKHKNSSAEKDV